MRGSCPVLREAEGEVFLGCSMGRRWLRPPLPRYCAAVDVEDISDQYFSRNLKLDGADPISGALYYILLKIVCRCNTTGCSVYLIMLLEHYKIKDIYGFLNEF